MRRVPRMAWLLALFVAGPARQVCAGGTDNPPPPAGWTHAPAFTPYDTPLRQGVLLSGAVVIRSSPTIADVDGDSSNGKEVVVGGNDGRLYVYGADGAERWSADPMPPCSAEPEDGKMNSVAAVGALDGDGIPYVVVTFGTILHTNCDGGAAAFDGRTGRLKWRFSLKDWQRSEGYPEEGLYGAVSSPALADTEGDGTMEIAFGGFDRNLYLLNHDGTVRWYYHAADTIWSSPLFMNVDDDAPLEVVVGTDMSANSHLTPPMVDGGFVYAFKTRPRFPPRIEFGAGYLWRTPNLGQAIYSSPVAGDVLQSNPGQEIIIGSGCVFPLGSADKSGKWIKILRPGDGAVLQTLDVPPGGTCIPSTPALGDIDDDGELEVVATVGSRTDTGGDGFGRVVAWDPENPTPKWSTIPYGTDTPPESPSGNDGNGGDFQSPVIADLDGNGSLEVIAPNLVLLHVLNGRDGVPLTCQSNACGSQTSMYAWGPVRATPAVGDLTGDGALSVFIGGMHYYSPAGNGLPTGGRGILWAWTGFAGLLRSPAGAQPPFSAPWPMFRGNPVAAPGGPDLGNPSGDPCHDLPDLTFVRIACDVQRLLDAPPCELTPGLARQLRRLRAALLGGSKAVTPRRVRRLRTRARVRLNAARRAARRLDATCLVAMSAHLDEMAGAVQQASPP